MLMIVVMLKKKMVVKKSVMKSIQQLQELGCATRVEAGILHLARRSKTSRCSRVVHRHHGEGYG